MRISDRWSTEAGDCSLEDDLVERWAGSIVLVVVRAHCENLKRHLFPRLTGVFDSAVANLNLLSILPRFERIVSRLRCI